HGTRWGRGMSRGGLLLLPLLRLLRTARGRRLRRPLEAVAARVGTLQEPPPGVRSLLLHLQHLPLATALRARRRLRLRRGRRGRGGLALRRRRLRGGLGRRLRGGLGRRRLGRRLGRGGAHPLEVFAVEALDEDAALVGALLLHPEGPS